MERLPLGPPMAGVYQYCTYTYTRAWLDEAGEVID
jgi:hypothetical protein